ncbi:hypothetical protein A3H87_02010 [Candidatus Curtissbacteria bacterium RIFCSPLOWO2_02_FULL_42_37]|uniref:FCP1 homology domain-containing protein n=1 Tax=Candidatus Curtissbacteria bacterium RIFCSPLOWO2_01_FULL_42_50 TaxID=1797730 RepID=A0A1F5H2E4_9BACT|nr:MAG: hypothetical protein A3E71_02650 [Candidatus Curtissbacteria bacterium RIFCSPHIGHO2_12_FULL_42_33]OGD98268.1 MAG: hypothetical protein A3B54_04090 [Candidatus Curtissbacteria bacterium RIFCSPLOWO2_01_FULL_42_50]OGE03469.1 MAG: hypothetical protein A3G16_02625 [Candidatus Curtissbacteria bacterium RIFCSPLOWO2_12_FULL_41_16]OGE10340.1 MAG: hypothetical protein A3H87_02010 [Candidatus Curtissbacteria bacterium RIFCSPLOWO2_02_FULL_42_37]
MIKASLIDLDGFLVNSEELYLEANKIYFKQFNFEFTEDLHRQGTGQKFAEWIKTVTSINKSGEDILRERNVIFFDIVRKRLQLLDGAKEFLEMVRKNFKTALVTSSKKDYVDLVFELTSINNYFDLVITGEQITKGKPDPEPFLLAAKKLKVEPNECVVFEDAPSGVLSGKNAGTKVIAIPSQFVKGDDVFKEADLVFNSLKELTLEMIKSL